MARIYIPPPMRDLSDGRAVIDVHAATVRDAVEAVEQLCPGISARLVEGGQLRAGLSVTVDGAVASRGLRQELQLDSEVHFLPALGGG